MDRILFKKYCMHVQIWFIILENGWTRYKSPAPSPFHLYPLCKSSLVKDFKIRILYIINFLDYSFKVKTENYIKKPLMVGAEDMQTPAGLQREC